MSFDVTKLKAELDRATTLVASVEKVMGNQAAVILTHAKKITDQATLLAEHKAAIAAAEDVNNTATQLNSSLHDKLSELETFLTKFTEVVPVANTVANTVSPVVANTVSPVIPLVSVVANTVANTAPVLSDPVAALTAASTPVTDSVAPVTPVVTAPVAVPAPAAPIVLKPMHLPPISPPYHGGSVVHPSIGPLNPIPPAAAPVVAAVPVAPVTPVANS